MSFIPFIAFANGKMALTAAGAVAAAGLALWGYFTAKPESAKTPCKTCKGSGKFHKKGKDGVVKTYPCLKCSATNVTCHACKGSGTFYNERVKKSFPCSKCPKAPAKDGSAPTVTSAPVKVKKCGACKNSGWFKKGIPCKFCTKQPTQQKVTPEKGQKTVKGPREVKPRIPVNHATRPEGHMDEGLRHRRHAIVHHEDDNGAGIGLHLLQTSGGIGVPRLPQPIKAHPDPEGGDAHEDSDDEESVAAAPEEEEGSDAPEEEGQSSEEEPEGWEHPDALNFVVPVVNSK